MNPTPAAVLVIGAAGRLGQAATAAFAAAGWRVLAMARRAPSLPLPGVTRLDVALDDTAALVAQARGVRAVVYAVNPPLTAWKAQALPLARLAMDVAEKLGASFMLPGNVYNFGEQMPARLDEATPERPSTVKGRIRCDLEAEVEARSRSGLRSVVLRAGDFFGAGHGNWFDQAIVKHIGRGKLVYPGPLDVPHAWAYLPDLARAFVAAAARHDLPAHARLHFEGHTLTGAELLAALERCALALGIVPEGGFRHGGLPWPLIRAGGLFVPMWRELAEMAYLWRVPHRLDGSEMRRALGPLPVTDLDTALTRSLQALGLAGAATPSWHAAA
jgi:nucleoside-diphosphate-sugar epimerase